MISRLLNRQIFLFSIIPIKSITILGSNVAHDNTTKSKSYGRDITSI